MRKLYYFFVGCLLLASCSTTKTVTIQKNGKEETVEVVPSNVQFLDDFRHVPEATKEAFLKKNKALSDKTSILFLTLGYKGEVVKVYNASKNIYNGTTYTLKSNGVAGYMTVPNTEDILITDDYTKATALLEAKYLEKYKFVYVKKDNNKKDEPYTISYSNKLRPL
ncbi:hypothetical protein K5I29_12795 [Flavobacterium agricola]|uniref:Lipoprotein n=1 Tax=Flavobacterium agricola TaxID=2870839 RepID=A0ABY6LYP1_9FLAO|nr:hypothetical protein [Flavobacterium agricola]UYW01306.1 hypothetical protein K5I29_12795 [Flavobacterium agricola]